MVANVQAEDFKITTIVIALLDLLVGIVKLRFVLPPVTVDPQECAFLFLLNILRWNN